MHFIPVLTFISPLNTSKLNVKENTLIINTFSIILIIIMKRKFLKFFMCLPFFKGNLLKLNLILKGEFFKVFKIV